jgi:secretion/DNA translocation related TadE-like protein
MIRGPDSRGPDSRRRVGVRNAVAAVVRSDRGAGAVLALAIVAAVVVLGLSGIGLAGGLAARQRVIGASDLAALAAADAASGAASGDPCGVAARVATAGGGRLASCRVDGLVVDVTVVGSFSGIPLTAHSRAGPPP